MPFCCQKRTWSARRSCSFRFAFPIPFFVYLWAHELAIYELTTSVTSVMQHCKGGSGLAYVWVLAHDRSPHPAGLSPSIVDSSTNSIVKFTSTATVLGEPVTTPSFARLYSRRHHFGCSVASWDLFFLQYHIWDMSSGEAHREGVSNAFALSAWCVWVLYGVASYG